MNQTSIIQERIRFSDNGRLSGVLGYPAERPPRRAVLLCSPHPNFAGDMNNNVIAALAQCLSADSLTLRFDYRGIGDSRIDLTPGLSLLDYWDRIEQTRDYTDALADTAAAADTLHRFASNLPMLAMGYSFGAVTATRTAASDPRFTAMAAIAPPFKRIAFEFLAACPKPCMILAGENDFVYDADVAARLLATAGTLLTLERIQGADHFFRVQEETLTRRIAEFAKPYA